jgi:hypothetical protein
VEEQAGTVSVGSLYGRVVGYPFATQEVAVQRKGPQSIARVGKEAANGDVRVTESSTDRVDGNHTQRSNWSVGCTTNTAKDRVEARNGDGETTFDLDEEGRHRLVG